MRDLSIAVSNVTSADSGRLTAVLAFSVQSEPPRSERKTVRAGERFEVFGHEILVEELYEGGALGGLFAAPGSSGGMGVRLYVRRIGDVQSVASIEVLPVAQAVTVIRPGSDIVIAGVARDTAGQVACTSIDWQIDPATAGQIVQVSDQAVRFVASQGFDGKVTLTARAAGAPGVFRPIVIDVGTRPAPIPSLDPRRNISGPARARVGVGVEFSLGPRATWAVCPGDAGVVSADGLFTPRRPGAVLIVSTVDGSTGTLLVQVER